MTAHNSVATFTPYMFEKKYDQVNELEENLADIRARAEALRDQTRGFQPEMENTVKTLAEAFRDLQSEIEKILNDLE